MTLISTIYARGNADPPEGADAAHRNAVAYQIAWQQHGLIVLSPDTISDDWIRAAAIGEAIRQYGKRDK